MVMSVAPAVPAWTLWDSEPDLNQLLQDSSRLIQQGNPRKALVKLQKHRARFAENPEYLNNLAVAFVSNAQPEEAQKLYQQILAADPLYKTVSGNLVNLKLRLEGLDDSVEVTQQLFTQVADRGRPGYQEIADRSLHNQIPAEKPSLVLTTTPDQAPDGQPEENTVKQFIAEWAARWSKKDHAGYMQLYSTEFLGPNGEDYQRWYADRIPRLLKDGVISVVANGLEVRKLDDCSAVVEFDQQYSSDDFRDDVRKQLMLQWQDSGWRILREQLLEEY